MHCAPQLRGYSKKWGHGKIGGLLYAFAMTDHRYGTGRHSLWRAVPEQTVVAYSSRVIMGVGKASIPTS